MDIKSYELVMIIRGDLTDEEGQESINSYKELLTSSGGTLKYESHWGRRKLAYEIKKLNFGIYHLLYIEGDTELVEKLKKNFGFDEKIIKYFLIKADNLEDSYNRFEKIKADPMVNSNAISDAMGG